MLIAGRIAWNAAAQLGNPDGRLSLGNGSTACSLSSNNGSPLVNRLYSDQLCYTRVTVIIIVPCVACNIRACAV